MGGFDKFNFVIDRIAVDENELRGQNLFRTHYISIVNASHIRLSYKYSWILHSFDNLIIGIRGHMLTHPFPLLTFNSIKRSNGIII